MNDVPFTEQFIEATAAMALHIISYFHVESNAEYF